MQPTFDAVTRYIFSLSHPWLTFLATLVDEYLPLIYVVALFFHLNILREHKRLQKTAFAIILSLLITYALKYALQVPRPCI
ncbi:MAG: hypothetical protein N3G76_03165, partial [Candidatus Micrarchaeota archaeon]|nr:hypothetical protein [Candidatus Micrarchaeota archaeon]